MSATTFVDRALLAASVPRRRIGVRVMCAGFGLITAALYLQNIAWRRLLWGPDGMVPSAFYGAGIIAEHGATLYLVSNTTAWFEFIFWSGLLVTLLWAAGIFPILTGPLCFAFTWSLLARNDFVQDAGWNLLPILMLYLIVADCSFAAPATIRLPKLAARVPHVLVAMRGMLHNGAVALILFQLCLVYTASVFFKIQGHKWQDGTALYYILRSNQFDLSWVGSLIWHSALLVALGTYGTLLFQAAYPFWIWQRPYKYVVALAAVGFHIGIFVTMALPFFGAIMITAEAIVFSDDEYRRAYAWLRSRFAAPRAMRIDQSTLAADGLNHGISERGGHRGLTPARKLRVQSGDVQADTKSTSIVRVDLPSGSLSTATSERRDVLRALRAGIAPSERHSLDEEVSNSDE